MIRNYILVAIRNLRRYTFFSTINILGLSISMCICMAIMMLVADQLMYDRHNTNSGKIYRINSTPVDNEGKSNDRMDNATSPMTLKDELLNNYQGIEKAVRLQRGFGNHWLEVEGKDVNLPVKGYFADPGVLDFFEFELAIGNSSTALQDPFTVVLTKTAAKRLFKEENPVGLTLKVDKDLYTVTGILKETINKSHIVFDGLASMSTVTSLKHAGRSGFNQDDWFDFWGGWTYVMLEDDKTKENITPVLDDIYKRRIAVSVNPDQYKAKFELQGLLDITPGKLVNNSIGPSMPWIIVYFLAALSGIIMITSCFNFTNLSIARALTRAREVGIRKVNGAARFQIFFQFISESVLVAFGALIIAFVMVVLLKPVMLQLNFARMFQWDLQANYFVYGVFLVFSIFVGLLAGVLPASLLSGLAPVVVLKKLNNVKLFSRVALRKTLIVAQFTLSLIFIISVTLLYNQLDLFQHKDHGFNMNDNLVVRLNGTSAERIKNSLSKVSSVLHVSAVSHLPASGESKGSGFKKELSDSEWTSMSYFSTDEDYLSALSLRLKTGKYFDKVNGASNKNFIILNEEAVKALQYKSAVDAIGQQIIFQPDSSRKTIIGVVEDYNHQILFSKIEPMALLYNPDDFSLIHISYTGKYEDILRETQKSWRDINAGLKMDARPLYQSVAGFYDTIFGDLVHIVGVVAILAIFISCMGLMGMVTYTTETRLKEVAIRKVLGSKDGQLILLLSNGFLKLLVISIVIGIPISWLLNTLWLDMIAYRTAFSLQVVSVAVGTLLILGLMTVASQTIRAVFVNPVDKLRNE